MDYTITDLSPKTIQKNFFFLNDSKHRDIERNLGLIHNHRHNAHVHFL